MEPAAVLAIGLDPAASREVKRHAGWFIALGVVLIGLGVIALGAAGFVTLASVLLFGWLLVIAGIMQGVHAVRVRRWGGFTRHLLGGVLSLVVGLLMLANPAASERSLALVMATFFTIAGIVRLAAARSSGFPGHPYAMTSDAVAIFLGVVIGIGWPVSGAWTIGTFVTIALIFDGWSLVMAGVAAYERGQRAKGHLRLVRSTTATAH